MADFPDTSHHNPDLNFGALRAAGVTQIVMKATQGSTFTDDTFALRWRLAGEAGLNRGAYHFAWTDATAITEARRLYRLAHDSELPPCLDWENAKVTIGWAQDFLSEADQLWQRKALLYLPQSWCSRSGALVAWPIWVARYNRTLGNVRPWAAPTWWQYTDKGHLGPHFGDVSHAYTDLANPTPAPTPPALEEDDMPRALRSARSGATFVVDPGPKTIWKIKSSEQLAELYALKLITPDPGNVPGEVSGEFLDDFRTIG